MKTNAVLALALLLLPAFAGAQSAPASGVTRPDAPGSVANPPAVRGINTSEVRRVTKDSLKAQVTARHLLGKPVYDRQGNKIGDIQDVLPGGRGPASAAGKTGDPAAAALQSQPGPLGSDRVAEGGNATSGAERGGGQPAAASPDESAVIISTGGVAGFGSILLRVPLSQ